MWEICCFSGFLDLQNHSRSRADLVICCAHAIVIYTQWALKHLNRGFLLEEQIKKSKNLKCDIFDEEVQLLDSQAMLRYQITLASIVRWVALLTVSKEFGKKKEKKNNQTFITDAKKKRSDDFYIISSNSQPQRGRKLSRMLPALIQKILQ